jgi:hypothetical protein
LTAQWWYFCALIRCTSFACPLYGFHMHLIFKSNVSKVREHYRKEYRRRLQYALARSIHNLKGLKDTLPNCNRSSSKSFAQALIQGIYVVLCCEGWEGRSRLWLYKNHKEPFVPEYL